MSSWTKVGLLSLVLLAAAGAGWLFGARTRLRMPNVWVSSLLLVAGSLGGPALTYKLLGPGLWSYVLALSLAGFCTGLAFWPMGERQGEREWL
jgi:hypothetical protein